MKLTNDEIEMLTQAEKKAESTSRNKKILAVIVIWISLSVVLWISAITGNDKVVSNDVCWAYLYASFQASFVLIAIISGVHWALGVLSDD